MTSPRPTPPPSDLDGGEPVTKRYRLTVRARLALTYSALLTGAGIVLLAIVYVFMRYVPTYDFAAATTASTDAASVAPGGSLVPTDDPTAPAAVVVPASELLVTSSEQLLNLLLVTSIVVLVVLAVLGTAVGWAVAGRMLRPLQDINSAVHRASEGDLAQRIRLSGPRDEISELAESFDEMLDRLDRSFTATRRFAANASHELRTPLATTRAMLDVALAQHDDPEERVVFDRLRVMNERNIETVTALLDLARIDSSPPRLEQFDPSRVVAQAIESCAEEAAAHDVRIEHRLTETTIDGEPVLLRQLVTNLVQNGIRHNEPGGFLAIEAAPSDVPGGWEIEVVSSGQVLDPEAVERFTDPFMRGTGRTRNASSAGQGLGLSIVAAIVDRFRGELRLAPRQGGGLRVSVLLPPARSVNGEHPRSTT
ncbi:sensor histidine kinase [Oerskovia enterophila]|uniref:histidine kinase n=1 Tax=Oerskovia enterophila TaxID=43678 RepID=A0A161XID7_9CELL|nr:HAMP domain-containing sensor histidine kinase [Oerskovia enterophila]KZM36557.1 putative sensor histidine kinase TcrY [Oerskovia enterophila]